MRKDLWDCKDSVSRESRRKGRQSIAYRHVVVLPRCFVVVDTVKAGCDEGGICVGRPSSLRSVHDYVITVNL